MYIRKVLDERKKKYNSKKRMTKATIILVIAGLILHGFIVPEAIALFRDIKSSQITLTVTNSEKQINASLIFSDIPNTSLLASLDRPASYNSVSYQPADSIFGSIFLEEDYDVNNVDQSTVRVYKGGVSLPIKGISIEGSMLVLSFSKEDIKSALGYGSHIIQAEGMFSDGWVCFVGQGTLEIIDEAAIAEQEAIQMVAELESDETQLTREKIDSCRTFVEGIREGEVKNDLLQRLNDIQKKLDMITLAIREQRQLEEAENAVLRAEETQTQADYDAAQGLVDGLPDGTGKSQLQERLKAVKNVLTSSPEESPPVNENAPSGAYGPENTSGSGIEVLPEGTGGTADPEDSDGSYGSTGTSDGSGTPNSDGADSPTGGGAPDATNNTDGTENLNVDDGDNAAN